MTRYHVRWRPSRRSQHMSKRGKPKHGYATRDEAETARIEMTYKTGYAFKLYRCPVCDAFHIGKEIPGY